jgi:hypothetical protein
LGLVSFFCFFQVNMIINLLDDWNRRHGTFFFLFPISMEGADNNDGLCAQGLFFFSPSVTQTLFSCFSFWEWTRTDIYIFFYFKKKKLGRFWSQMCLILFSRPKWNVVLWSPPWRATWRPLL